MLSFQVHTTPVEVHPTRPQAGRTAAGVAARILNRALSEKGKARIIVGTGASQLETIEALLTESSLDWPHIEAFHMDEYVGLPIDHPASFRGWLKTHLADRVPIGRVHYLAGDAEDDDLECRRYADLLLAAPVDLCFIGFGENGHIAFNDPHVADFSDPLAVKRVEMDERCRMQQVGEGAFPKLEAVPKEALTLTIPTLMRSEHLICTVPDRRKAEAVRGALEGPLSTECPASIVVTHPRAAVFLDRESASLLEHVQTLGATT